MAATALIVERHHESLKTGRVLQVQGMFDVPPDTDAGHLQVTVPPEMVAIARGESGTDWNIGLIVGPSGAGKSTVARELFGAGAFEPFTWSDRALIDDFPHSISAQECCGLLTAVGLGSPPSWLRPYATLSTGEQFRATVARHLAQPDELAVIDEFTSTVDRTVAQVSSHATQKAVRRSGRRLVAISCHFDLVDWLQPDWLYRPDTEAFQWRHLQRHPPIDLEIAPVPHAAWPPFSRHHYLSSSLHGAARCWGAFYGEECVAFNSVIPFPHPQRANIRMGHRLVVLPDYQGLGIGLRFDDWVGEYLNARGYRYHKTVSHPALISAYARSPRWHMMEGANRPTRGGAKRLRKTMQSTRKLATRSFRYEPVVPRIDQPTVLHSQL